MNPLPSIQPHRWSHAQRVLAGFALYLGCLASVGSLIVVGARCVKHDASWLCFAGLGLMYIVMVGGLMSVFSLISGLWIRSGRGLAIRAIGSNAVAIGAWIIAARVLR
jgi:hypothetical protein